MSILNGHTGAIQSYAFSHNKNTLATLEQKNTIHLWDIKADSVRGRIERFLIKQAKRLTCHLQDRAPIRLQIYLAQISRMLRKTRNYSSPYRTIVLNTSDEVQVIYFSPDRKTLATIERINDESYTKKMIRLWDLETEKLKINLTGHSSKVRSLLFSQDGKHLASVHDNNSIILWDIQKGKIEANIAEHSKYLSCAAFSPDSKTLATGSIDKTIRLWDVKSGKQKATLHGHTLGISKLSFSPDGETLASVSYDCTILLWNLKETNR